MKTKIKTLLLATALVAPLAHSNELLGLMPTIIGGMAGYKIADNYGGSDGEMAAAAVGGAYLANRYMASRSYNYAPASPSVYYPARGNDYSYACSRQVPPAYQGNPGATNAWVSGCIRRQQEQQAAFEQQAYQDGLR